MDGQHLQDLISRGMGTAARLTGVPCDVYRPSGTVEPLRAANRFLRLPAAFNAEDPNFHTAADYAKPVWYGVFDSAYTRPGDYLVEHGTARTWFVADQPHLLPIVCVLTSRTVSVFRPEAPGLPRAASYGGANRRTLEPLLLNWPASVIAGGAGERTPARLPADVRVGGYRVLLPPSATLGRADAGTLQNVLRADDLMSDDLGRNYVISSAELTELGWRIAVKLSSA